MKVGELIALLERTSRDAEVIFQDKDGTWNTVMFIDYHKNLHTDLGKETIISRYPNYAERIDIKLRGL